jgi:iduronate 2-sulfatase
MRHSRLLSALLCVIVSHAATAQDATSRRPNVLFIAVDDLRPELGCYGVSDIRSPNIDRLAASGVKFERAYCQQAVCNASRASLLTGLRPDSTRVWDLVTPLRTTIPDVVTLPQYFKQHGYQSVGMGKIYHNTFPDPDSWSIPEPKPTGFQLYSAETQAKLKVRRDAARAQGKTEAQISGSVRGLAAEGEDVADERRFDGALGNLAIEHLQKLSQGNTPFFFAVGFIQPHLPFTAPKRYWDLYDPAKLRLATNPFLPKSAPAMAMFGMYELRAYMDFADTKEAPALLTEEQQRHLKHGYYASATFIDTQIGRLLDELDRLSLRDNTIVVLWADHGWKLGEHASWCKQTNYEIDARVPFIVRAPGAKGNGKPCAGLVELLDIYPTLCDLAGLPIQPQLEGKSIAPLLADPTQPGKSAAFSQFPRRQGEQRLMGYSMRTDRYRYVEWLDRSNGNIAAQELYDHVTDDAENENIAGQPGKEALLKQLSEQMRRELPRPIPPS